MRSCRRAASTRGAGEKGLMPDQLERYRAAVADEGAGAELAGLARHEHHVAALEVAVQYGGPVRSREPGAQLPCNCSDVR